MDVFLDAEHEKNIIFKELFLEGKNNQCLIDIYLKIKSVTQLKISKVSIEFLKKSKKKLQKKYDSENILLFRLYAYENILITYLKKKYKIDGFKYNLLEMLEEISRYDDGFDKRLRSEIPTLKWSKKIKPEYIVYTAINKNGKEIQVCSFQNIQTNIYYHVLFYDKQCFKCAWQYIDKIKATKPSIEKSNIIIVVNEKNRALPKQSAISKKKSQRSLLDPNLDPVRMLKHNLFRVGNKYKISDNTILAIAYKIQVNCFYYRDHECSRLNENCVPCSKECLYYDKFMGRVLHESKVRNRVNKVKKISNTSSKENDKNVRMKDTKNEKKSRMLEIGVKDFVVRGNTFKCTHNKHTIDNVDAKITIVLDSGKKQQIKITAGYCRQCKVYFIMESTYQKLKHMGFILCRVTDEKVYHKSGFMNGAKLAQESILMQYGYNVSQLSGLSATRRQKILAVIIDNKVLSKSEIISYLDFFIRQRSNRSNMAIAISKWQDDREFVEHYKIGHYTQFGVNAIYRR